MCKPSEECQTFRKQRGDLVRSIIGRRKKNSLYGRGEKGKNEIKTWNTRLKSKGRIQICVWITRTTNSRTRESAQFRQESNG